MTGSIHRRIADRIRGDGETARASGPIAAGDLLGGVLAEVVHTVPYSSASQFYDPAVHELDLVPVQGRDVRAGLHPSVRDVVGQQ